MAGILDFLLGSGDSLNKLDNFSPEKKAIYQQLMQQIQGIGGGGGYGQAMNVLQQYLDPNSDAYKNMEKPYMDQFNQQIVPGIAEKFAGGGALSSSSFGQALGGAGANLQSQLGNMKMGYQQQAASGILGQYNQMMNQGMAAEPYSYMKTQGSRGVLPQMIGGALSGGFGGFMNQLGGNLANRWFPQQ